MMPFLTQIPRSFRYILLRVQLRAVSKDRQISRSMKGCWLRYHSDSSPTRATPPLVNKFRDDLKSAMRSKDSTRLLVLRSLLADVTNASKTSNPIETDMQLLALLRKRTDAGRSAAAEFEAAGRRDLSEKEEAQVQVMEEYAEGVAMVGVEEIRRSISSAMEDLRAKAEKVSSGQILKRLIGPGGSLHGRNVENKEIARIVKETLGT